MGQRQEWARRVVDLSEWLAPSEEWPQISGTVAKTLGIDPTPPPKSDLLVPAVFLDFFSRTLDFAGFPYRSRRPLAAASDTDRKPKASERIREQVSDGVRDPKWVREDTIGFILAQLSSNYPCGARGCGEIIRNAVDSVRAPHPDQPMAHGLPACGMSPISGSGQTEYRSRTPTSCLGTGENDSCGRGADP